VSGVEEIVFEGKGQPNPCAFAAHREDWEICKRNINQSKIRWLISTFKPLKSAGTDGIVPALLQQGVDVLMTHLCHIFRAFLARGWIPKAWRQVKVMIIPGPKKANYTEAKAYRPISLLPFMLKRQKNWCTSISGTRFWGYIPYIDTNFPANQEVHRNYSASGDHMYRGRGGKQGRYTWSIPK